MIFFYGWSLLAGVSDFFLYSYIPLFVIFLHKTILKYSYTDRNDESVVCSSHLNWDVLLPLLLRVHSTKSTFKNQTCESKVLFKFNIMWKRKTWKFLSIPVKGSVVLLIIFYYTDFIKPFPTIFKVRSLLSSRNSNCSTERTKRESTFIGSLTFIDYNDCFAGCTRNTCFVFKLKLAPETEYFFQCTLVICLKIDGITASAIELLFWAEWGYFTVESLTILKYSMFFQF